VDVQKFLLAGSEAICLVFLGASQGSVHAQEPAPSARVSHLVECLTLDEKLALTQGTADPVDGGQAGYTRGVPRLGIPPLRWVDGPGGIDNRYDATTVPASLAIASTFSPDEARANGELIGREARATRMDVFLGPMVNIARVPNWGRNITGFGEDPFLTSKLAVPMVEGIQKWGVIATTKHFVANNQMYQVMGASKEIPGADFIVDERTMHEIYLPAFEATSLISGAMMAAYNRINGLFNSASAPTQNKILRGDFGWSGLMVSDWGAVHSTDAILAGLDVEMPGDVITRDGNHYFFGNELKDAIEAGKIPIAALDRAVAHVLTVMERVGMLDNTRVVAPTSIDVDGDAKISRRLASEGAVLLKNDGVLPLSANSTQSIAFIGPTAGQLAAGQGFGAAVGFEARKTSPLEAFKQLAPVGTNVIYSVGDDLTGVAIPSSALRNGKGETGLSRLPDDGTSVSTDQTLDFIGDRALPVGRGYIWSGVLVVPEDGEYTIACQSWGGAAVLNLDGVQIAKSAKPPLTFGVPRKTGGFMPTTDGLDNGQEVLQLKAGKEYQLVMSGQAEPESRMQIRLAWVTPAMHRDEIARAAKLASTVQTAVVFVWQRGGEWAKNQENLSLPDHQDELVAAVAAANPRTIVVLNTAGPIAMPWEKQVKAILELWFPGQEGGWATADLLLGKQNPSGHLPMTFPVHAQDSPVFAPGHPERYYGTAPNAGSDNRVIYSEGIFVGYRYFDEDNVAPLFPFGHGLSYTKFDYSDLTANPTKDGLNVRFRIKNSGPVEGTEVAQIYLGRPLHPPIAMAPAILVGFDRITLQPGATKVVDIYVAPRQLSNWVDEKRGWKIANGERQIEVGASSRDIRLKTVVAVGVSQDPNDQR
jgi:beta-glucosidase